MEGFDIAQSYLGTFSVLNLPPCGGLMACDAPARQCFEWHILPHLARPKPSDGGNGARALCPAHDDGAHSLGVSIGDRQRIIWQCFAGCSRTRVRAALIEAGIPSECLPLVTREREDLLDIIRKIVTADTADHAGIRLRILAALEGYADLPRGGELERIAALVRVNRVTAYRARRLPLPSTDNPGSYPPAAKPVKPRRSRERPEVA